MNVGEHAPIAGDHLVLILGHVADDGMLWVAPEGSDEFPPGGLTVADAVRAAEGWADTDELRGWALVGPVDDLPEAGPLGNIRTAYWAAIMQGGSLCRVRP